MAKAQAARKTSEVVDLRKIVAERRRGQHSYVTLLGLRTYETLELLKRVEAGFSYKAFERLQRALGLPTDELAKLVHITPRTLARRKEEGRLTAEESDRLLRASRVFGKVLALFEGDLDAARTWFSKPSPALGNHPPQAIASTDVGAREVENLIGRLEHGVFA